MKIFLGLSLGFLLGCCFAGDAYAAASDNKASQEAEALIKGLTAEGSPHKKGAIIEKLGKMEAVEAVPEIIRLLKDADLGVKLQSCVALGRIKDKRAMPHLFQKLKDNNENWAVRVKSAEALSGFEDSSVFDPLVDALRYESEADRKNEKLNPPLRHDYISADEYLERAFAEPIKKYILESQDKKQYISGLKKQMNDKGVNNVFRYRLAVILAELNERGAVPVLNECLKKSQRGELKTRSAYLLGKLEAKESIPTLKAALKDDFLSYSYSVNEDVGKAQIRQMELNNGSEIFSSLQLEKSGDHYEVYCFAVRDAAAGALKKLGVKVVKDGNGYRVLDSD